MHLFPIARQFSSTLRVVRIMAGEKQTFRAFLIIIKLLLSSEMKKKKNHGNVVFCENTSTDCMGKGGGRRDAHSSRWRNLHLARAVFPECDMFVAVPGDCFRLHCWVKQQKGKNLRLVWTSTQISKYNLSCSDFSYLQNSGGIIMRMSLMTLLIIRHF